MVCFTTSKSVVFVILTVMWGWLLTAIQFLPLANRFFLLMLFFQLSCTTQHFKFGLHSHRPGRIRRWSWRRPPWPWSAPWGDVVWLGSLVVLCFEGRHWRHWRAFGVFLRTFLCFLCFSFGTAVAAGNKKKEITSGSGVIGDGTGCLSAGGCI